MSPLATKNNALVLKDGKLTEDCDCCQQNGACCYTHGQGANATTRCAGSTKAWCDQQTDGTFGGSGSVCSGSVLVSAKRIEITLQGSDRVVQWSQAANFQFASSAYGCIYLGDEVWSSYVFAGSRMAGTYSLTKTTSGVSLPNNWQVVAGEWYYYYSDDDIAWLLVAAQNAWGNIECRLRANVWGAAFWNLTHPRGSIFIPTGRVPNIVNARYFGIGERLTARDYDTGNVYCIEQRCNDGVYRPQFNGPSASSPPTATVNGSQPVWQWAGELVFDYSPTPISATWQLCDTPDPPPDEGAEYEWQPSGWSLPVRPEPYPFPQINGAPVCGNSSTPELVSGSDAESAGATVTRIRAFYDPVQD